MKNLRRRLEQRRLGQRRAGQRRVGEEEGMAEDPAAEVGTDGGDGGDAGYSHCVTPASHGCIPQHLSQKTK